MQKKYLLALLILGLGSLLFWVSLESNQAYQTTLRELGFEDSTTAESAQETSQAALDAVERSAAESGLLKGQTATSAPSTQADGMLIVLRDGSTGLPVANAKVWTFPYGKPELQPEIHSLLMQGVSPEMVGERFHPPVISNQLGQAWVTYYPKGQAVVARSADRYGWNPKHHQDLRLLKMWPESLEELQVRDHQDHPLPDIPVGLTRVTEKTVEFMLGSVVLTDSEGTASFYHFANWGALPNAEQLQIRPFLHLRDPLGIPLLQWAQSSVHTWTLPPLGRLKIQVVDQQHELLTGPIPVLLAIDPEPERGFVQGRRPPHRFPSGGLTQIAHDGVAEFPFVGLGLDFAAAAPTADPTESTRAFGRGPWQEGQVVVLEAKPLRQPSTLRFRVLDLHGNPYIGKPLWMKLDPTGWLSQEISIATDKLGVVTYDLHPNQVHDLNSTAWFSLREEETPGQRCNRARVEVPEMETGILDLGDVTLEDSGPYLSGVVVGPQGEPQPGVVISVTSAEPVASNPFELYAITNEAGHFFQDTHSAPAITRLSVHHTGLPVELDLARDTQGIRIVLEPGLTLDGIILPPQGMKATDLSVAFLNEHGERTTFIQNLRGDGTFHLDGLAPGLGSLAVYDDAYVSVIFTLPDLQPVVVGQDSDPRINPLDLSHALLSCDLLVVDETGAPIKGVRVYRLEQEKSHQWVLTDGEGFANIPLLQQNARILLTARDFRPQYVSILDGARTVVMKPGFRTRMQLNPAPKLPSGYALGCAFWLRDQEVQNLISTSMVTFDANGSTLADIPGAGDLHASIWVLHNDEFLGFLRDWHSSTPYNFVEVDEADLGAEVIIPISLEQVDALIQSSD